MASTDIQIVNISNLEKIESFINDSAYREVIENSENYNARLCIERRLRMPFLDPQTGVAQNHCSLFMKRRQRMPGLREGQIYTYPAARWRKSRRQYLLHQHRPFGMLRDADVDSIVGLDGSSLGAGDTDSKDSQHMMKDETVAKDWYYDEMEMHEMEAFDDPEPDSDFDYEEPYSSRRRRKRGNGPPSRRSNIANTTVIETPPPKRGRGGGRGRRKTTPSTTPSHPPQPFESGNSNDMMPHTPTSSNAMTPVRRGRPGPPPLPSNANSSPLSNSEEPQMPILTPEQKLPDDIDDKTGTIKPIEKGKATPSPYCDFCLGDARENKKTRQPEELVSCSDCGRSGHPTCLQFTTNMIISVKKYRWQCIECKYCSICGTSDNDDQLLFCDDCDRGYHMYCLSPPLTVPPEGSWSCKLCNDEFHTKK